jgi:glutaminyl-tRNA synthetase
MASTDYIPLFKSIGLTQAKAAEAAKSPKSATLLVSLIESNDLTARVLDEKKAVLIAAFAVQSSKSENVTEPERKHVVEAILDGRLKSTDQVGGEFEI